MNLLAGEEPKPGLSQLHIFDVCKLAFLPHACWTERPGWPQVCRLSHSPEHWAESLEMSAEVHWAHEKAGSGRS